MMHWKIVWMVLGVVGFSATAPGQATQPVEKPAVAAPAEEQAWPKVVDSLARALVNGDRAVVTALQVPKCAVRRFGTVEQEDVAKLLDRVAKSTVVGQHGYLHPPLVMAADIAADFKNAPMIGDAEKVRFVIDDDSDMKRANATAVQWVVEQLDARQGVPIGVIVLWTPRPAAASSAAPAFDAVFVLCRGEETSPRQFKLTRILYGLPLTEN